MFTYILAGIANFAFIGLKAFQQQNVVHLNYGWMVGTNTLLVIAEMFVIGKIAVEVMSGDVMSIVWTGLALNIGGASGCACAMFVHSNYISKRGKKW